MLSLFGQEKALAVILTTWAIPGQTVYDWMTAFIIERLDSLK
jgi:hypothetical protein